MIGLESSKTAQMQLEAAPLWKRGIAYLLDVLFVLPYVGVLVAMSRVFPELQRLFSDTRHAQIFQFLILTFPVGCWFIFTESSGWRATPGKRWLRLKVSYDESPRVLPAAIVRNCAKLAPWELNHALMWHMRASRGVLDSTAWLLMSATWGLLLIYLAGAVFDRRHRTPYDRLSGTVVVNC